MKKNEDLEFAIILHAVEKDNETVKYLAVAVLEGYYDEDLNAFIDNKYGEIYPHAINGPEDYGYIDRISCKELKRKYPLLPKSLIKKIIIRQYNKYGYMFIDKDCNNCNIPLFISINEKEETEVFYDYDIINIYQTFYPKEVNELMSYNSDSEEKITIIPKKKTSTKKSEVGKIEIDDLYKKVTESVIDQDEPIKKILTAIWKQYNDFSSNKSRNILINGSTGVGKTEIFRVLSKLIDVPCVITSATEYTATGYIGKSVDDMLVSLLAKTDGVLEKAERGILIIDEIDKLSEGNSGHSQVNQRDVQEALLKILEDGVFTVKYNGSFYEFNTSKLMIIGMGSWSRIDLTPDKVVGFEQKREEKSYKDITREDIVRNGIIPELIARFPVLVQMNELNQESFVRILKSKNSNIGLNKDFFSKMGVNLNITEGAIKKVAEKADKNNYGARGLDEIIERALSCASFEIASNPDKYSELIIDEDTIEDNKKYTLVKKRRDN